MAWFGLAWPGLVKPGLAWPGLAWSGLAWCDLAWSGLAWIGLVWLGLVWLSLDWVGLVWLGLVWLGLVWLGLVWLGLAWSGLACFGPAWIASGFPPVHFGRHRGLTLIQRARPERLWVPFPSEAAGALIRCTPVRSDRSEPLQDRRCFAQRHINNMCWDFNQPPSERLELVGCTAACSGIDGLWRGLSICCF